jgi:hypothetical protein
VTTALPAQSDDFSRLAEAARPQEAPTSGYSVTDVRGSAREAGIATKAIDRALAEYGLAPGGSTPLTPARVSIAGR